jgi:O-antigen/teichoic acid export membrane protein
MFWKGLWGYLPANILQGLIGFLTLSVFTRILSPEDYGRYALAFGISALAQTVAFTWIEAAMARFYPAESLTDPKAPALYGTLYRIFAGITILFALISGLGLWLWQVDGPDGAAFKLAVGLGLGVVVFRSLIKMVQEQRRSEGRVGIASIIDMIQSAGGFALGVGLAMMGLGGGSPLLGAGLIALLTLPFVVREDWGRALKGKFVASQARVYAHYGFPVALSLILTLALFTVDRFMIAYYLGEAEAGAYHAGYSLASRILDVVFIWLGSAGGPALVMALETGGPKALQNSARTQIKTMALVMFPAVGGLIMVSAPLSELLIGEALRKEALLVTPLISLGALFSGFTTYYALQAFTLAKKTKLLMLAMAIPAVANIGLNAVLIPIYGLWGAGLATAISFGLGLISALLLGRAAITLPVAWIDLIKIAFCTAIMMACLWAIPSFGGVLELGLKSVCGLIIYAVLALSLNLNHINERAKPLLKGFMLRLKK